MIHISLRKQRVYATRTEIEYVTNELGRPLNLSDFIPDKTTREEYLAECVNAQLERLRKEN
ncbi:hypothetical protein KAT80_00895 [Candidatus Pacearchaeota archaeon]|nr:hypothetical protein [Candidatus Pacearchaeota archaeon]